MHPILTQAQKDELEQQLREEIKSEGSLGEWNKSIMDYGSDVIRRANVVYGHDNPDLEQVIDGLVEKFEQEEL